MGYIQESTFTHSTAITNYIWRFKYDRGDSSLLFEQREVVLSLQK